jgi:membrane-bound lytic murein transglycosylase MltF
MSDETCKTRESHGQTGKGVRNLVYRQGRKRKESCEKCSGKELPVRQVKAMNRQVKG